MKPPRKAAESDPLAALAQSVAVIDELDYFQVLKLGQGRSSLRLLPQTLEKRVDNVVRHVRRLCSWTKSRVEAQLQRQLVIHPRAAQVQQRVTATSCRFRHIHEVARVVLVHTPLGHHLDTQSQIGTSHS